MAYNPTSILPGNILTGDANTPEGMHGRWFWGGGPTEGDMSRVYQSMFGQNQYRPVFYKIDESASNRNYGASLEGRGMQRSLADELNRTMQGQGPTVAGLQMQQGIGKALADIPSVVNSARGVNRGLAFRQAALGGMAAAQQANRDAALMRAQEQLSARSQYGQVAGEQRQGDLEARSQDIGIERGNQATWSQLQGLEMQKGEGNAERGQKGAGGVASAIGSMLSDIQAKSDISPVRNNEFASALRNLYETEWKGAQPKPGNQMMIGDSLDAGMGASTRPDSMGQPFAMPASSPSAREGMGAGLQSLGGMLSDRETKTGIGKVLGDLDAYRFEYREPVARRMALEAALDTYDDARHPRLGIMAQDLNRSKLGDSATVTTRNGEALDMKRSLGLSLAGLANLDDRLRKLERAA